MQSDIFRYVLKTISTNYKEYLNDKVMLVDSFNEPEKKCQVCFRVTDIYQIANDKRGQKIVVGNQRYDVPTQFAMRIRLEFLAADQLELLSVMGQTAVFFKDNAVYELNEYDWHGNVSHKFFIEPVIRSTEYTENFKILFFEYRVEVQINSIKSERIVRVEKRDIRSNFVN